jgi:hypothetical protein
LHLLPERLQQEQQEQQQREQQQLRPPPSASPSAYRRSLFLSVVMFALPPAS